MRKLFFYSLLTLSLLIQGCNEDGGDSPASTAKPAAVKPVPQALPESSKKPEEKALPKGHPAMDAHSSSPADPMEVMRTLKTRLDQNPNDLEALISLGNANMMIERFANAAEFYERALVINPKDLDVRTNLAAAYKYTDKSDQAITELKKNLAADPRHGASLYNLGFIYYFDKKDPQAALPLWKQWLLQYPNIPEAEEIRGYVAQIEGTPAKPAADNKTPQKGA